MRNKASKAPRCNKTGRFVSLGHNNKQNISWSIFFLAPYFSRLWWNRFLSGCSALAWILAPSVSQPRRLQVWRWNALCQRLWQQKYTSVIKRMRLMSRREKCASVDLSRLPESGYRRRSVCVRETFKRRRVDAAKCLSTMKTNPCLPPSFFLHFFLLHFPLSFPTKWETERLKEETKQDSRQREKKRAVSL